MPTLFVRSLSLTFVLLLALSHLAGCTAADETAADHLPVATPEETPETLDQAAPAPGGDAGLTFSDITPYTVTIRWAAAKDDVSATKSLAYRVFHAPTENITTVKQAEASGTDVSGGWQTALTELQAADLSVNTRYVFFVFVRDEAGNTALYDPGGITTLDGAPRPGGGHVVTARALSTSALQVWWARADDDYTQPSRLTYRVFYAAAGPLDTVANVEANGTPGSDWQTDVTSATLTGLTEATPYFINVLVRNDEGTRAAYNVTAATTFDGTPPTVNDASLTFSGHTSTAFKVTWAAAADNVTPVDRLAYAVYYSLSDNLATLEEVTANGILGIDFTAGITSATLTGLSFATSYYVNVLVRDERGQAAVYSAAATQTAGVMTLFSAGAYSANRGGRAGLEALCTNAPAKPANCTAHAFASVNADDEIRDMPVNYGLPTNRAIVGPNGTLIANDWADLLDTTIAATLNSAGVTTNGWFSGAGSNGSADSHTCSGFTTVSSGDYAAVGLADYSSNYWIAGAYVACNVTLEFLCTCH